MEGTHTREKVHFSLFGISSSPSLGVVDIVARSRLDFAGFVECKYLFWRGDPIIGKNMCVHGATEKSSSLRPYQKFINGPESLAAMQRTSFFNNKLKLIELLIKNV